MEHLSTQHIIGTQEMLNQRSNAIKAFFYQSIYKVTFDTFSPFPIIEHIRLIVSQTLRTKRNFKNYLVQTPSIQIVNSVSAALVSALFSKGWQIFLMLAFLQLHLHHEYISQCLSTADIGRLLMPDETALQVSEQLLSQEVLSCSELKFDSLNFHLPLGFSAPEANSPSTTQSLVFLLPVKSLQFPDSLPSQWLSSGHTQFV